MPWTQGGRMNVFTLFSYFSGVFSKSLLIRVLSCAALSAALYSSRQQVIEDGAVYKISIKMFSQLMNNAWSVPSLQADYDSDSQTLPVKK